MGWFQLDPESMAARARQVGSHLRVPSLAGSILRGAIGFTAVSLAGFAPWAVFGHWFHRNTGEVGMYIACALVFIAASGLALHGLIIGPGSLGRFYKLFAIAFTLYAAAWIGAWMLLRGHAGSLAGLGLGTMLMGLCFAAAFEAWRAAPAAIAALFVLNTAGYYAGGWSEGALAKLDTATICGVVLDKKACMMTAMFSWGLFYGVGLGSGLGYALHACQAEVRARLRESGVAA